MKKFYIAYGLSVVILFALMFYSYENYHKYYPSLATFQDNPEFLEGVRAENCGIAEQVNEQGLIIRGGSERIKVKAENARYPKYGTICVVGTYKKDGFIEAEYVRYNDYIFVKYFLSVLSIIYVIYIFFMEWKITRKCFIARGKNA